MALGDQGIAHLGGRQVRVPTRRLESRVRVGVKLHDRADVCRQLRVLVFAPPTTARDEVFQTTHPFVRLVQPLLDRVAGPTEASFGQSGAAVAQLCGHLSLKQAALVTGQSSRPRTKQGVVVVHGAVHVD